MDDKEGEISDVFPVSLRSLKEKTLQNFTHYKSVSRIPDFSSMIEIDFRTVSDLNNQRWKFIGINFFLSYPLKPIE